MTHGRSNLVCEWQAGSNVCQQCGVYLKGQHKQTYMEASRVQTPNQRYYT